MGGSLSLSPLKINQGERPSPRAGRTFWWRPTYKKAEGESSACLPWLITGGCVYSIISCGGSYYLLITDPNSLRSKQTLETSISQWSFRTQHQIQTAEAYNSMDENSYQVFSLSSKPYPCPILLAHFTSLLLLYILILLFLFLQALPSDTIGQHMLYRFGQ